jgi:hypothetical protein
MRRTNFAWALLVSLAGLAAACDPFVDADTDPAAGDGAEEINPAPLRATTVHSFESGATHGWTGVNLAAGPWSAGEWSSHGMSALRGDVDFAGESVHYLSLVREQTFNATALVARVRMSSSSVRRVFAMLYVKTAPNWGWVDGGAVDLRSDAAGVDVRLDWAAVAGTAGPVREVGIFFVGSPADGSGRASLYLDDFRTVDNSRAVGATAWGINGTWTVDPAQRLFVLAGGNVSRVDLETGARLWTTPGTNTALEVCTALADRIVIAYRDRVESRDPRSGTLQWFVNEGPMYARCPPASTMVILEADDPSRALTAYRMSDGIGLWQAPAPPGPAVVRVDQRGVFLSWQTQTQMGWRALSATDGSTLWTQTAAIARPRHNTDGDGNLFAQENQTLQRIDNASGAVAWSVQGVTFLNHWIASEPEIALFVEDANTFRQIDRRTGAALYSYRKSDLGASSSVTAQQFRNTTLLYARRVRTDGTHELVALNGAGQIAFRRNIAAAAVLEAPGGGAVAIKNGNSFTLVDGASGSVRSTLTFTPTGNEQAASVAWHDSARTILRLHDPIRAGLRGALAGYEGGTQETWRSGFISHAPGVQLLTGTKVLAAQQGRVVAVERP